jgi:beta-lactam-binding protein with PASTA domain
MKRKETARNFAVLLLLAMLTACGRKVPNLVGMTEQQANEALAKVKLKGKFTEVHVRDQPGKIVAQDPPAGAKPSGDTVAIMIEAAASAGAGTPTTSGTPTGITVPDLSGKSLAEATAALLSLGLAPGKISVVANDKPPGTVSDQDPQARTQVAPEQLVDLSLAIGSLLVTVPANIVGQPQAAAEQMLRDAGLQVGAVTQEIKTDSTADGTVLRCSPCGTPVPKGTPVALVVKQPAVTVPHVVDLPLDTAKVRLMEAGLRPSPKSMFDPNGVQDRVTWQSMDGVPVAKETPIEIRYTTRTNFTLLLLRPSVKIVR